MSRTTYNYSVGIEESDGRNIYGRAVYWDRPQHTHYGYEEFASYCATKSLQEQRSFPLGLLHPWSPDAKTSPVPVGAGTFQAESDGLYFNFRFSETRDGDEAMTLYQDGALSDVSMGIYKIKTSKKGEVLRNEEIALRELSMVPTGFGALEGATVLASFSETPDLDALALSRSKLKLVILRAGLTPPL